MHLQLAAQTHSPQGEESQLHSACGWRRQKQHGSGAGLTFRHADTAAGCMRRAVCLGLKIYIFTAIFFRGLELRPPTCRVQVTCSTHDGVVCMAVSPPLLTFLHSCEY
jgi:hypothetical protein